MNSQLSPGWIPRAEEAFAFLAERPFLLWLLLFAVNTLALPYAGITHDTRLYGVQVLHHVEPGAFADDLFFRYGSQDDYTLFSRLAAPLVRCLGLPTAFFLIYLASKGLLFWGMMRLTLTLVPQRAAAVLALLYCMALPIHYGGHHILNIQEAFVTPRTPAIALVLLGLDLLLRARPIFSFLTMMLACALHPLMACGGLMIWGAWVVWTYLGPKFLLTGLAGALVLAAVVLSNEALGQRCLGVMDDEWRSLILNTSSFNFPSEWSPGDWCYLAAQLLILALAIGAYRSMAPAKARFLILLGGVTLAGSIGALLAERLPYALLLQGQPYRALWILAFLHLALAFWLCAEGARSPSLVGQLGSVALLAYLCWTDGLLVETYLPLLFFPLFVVALRGLEQLPHRPDWLVRSLQFSLVFGALVWTGYKMILLALRADELLRRYTEQRDLLALLLINLGPILFLAGIAWLLVRFPPSRWDHARARWLIGGVCLGVQTMCFAFPHTDYYRAHCTHYRGDLCAIRAALHRERPTEGRLPTVYSNLGCLDYVWLDLHAQSYFDCWQVGNFMFRRDMAIEGQRRATLVAPFELERYRRIKNQAISAADQAALTRFFQTEVERAPLNEEDLARLCQEPNLDYVLLEQGFEGKYVAHSGRLYLYDCRQLRTALSLTSAMTTVAVNR